MQTENPILHTYYIKFLNGNKTTFLAESLEFSDNEATLIINDEEVAVFTGVEFYTKNTEAIVS